MSGYHRCSQCSSPMTGPSSTGICHGCAVSNQTLQQQFEELERLEAFQKELSTWKRRDRNGRVWNDHMGCWNCLPNVNRTASCEAEAMHMKLLCFTCCLWYPCYIGGRCGCVDACTYPCGHGKPQRRITEKSPIITS